MNARLFRLLDLMRRRRALSSWVVGLSASLLLVGGAIVGAGDRQPAFADEAAMMQQAETAPAATVAPGVTSLRGVIVAVRPRALRLLTEDGRVVVVRPAANVTLRRAGKAIAQQQLQRGQKVVVLGRVQQDGALRARSIAVRGQVREKLPPRTASPGPVPQP
ncbi:MAG: hypothetical protein HYX51_10795 [Chloroflexi bacterium]|nr:hypothetical protein [Chloroflexota bacterium]